MGFLSNIFGKPESQKNNWPGYGVKTELHSHLLPGLDDGVESFEEAIEIIRQFSLMGVNRIITTPHIMGDFYRNTPKSIIEKRDLLREKIQSAQIDVQLDAAAEYYLDEDFLSKVNKKEELLTFGDKYILFETSYINESVFFSEAVFNLKTAGYKPVLAHPERYTYLYQSFEKFQDYFNSGVYFQLNINSLTGYYSKESKFFAEKLIENQMVDFIGSDCHGLRHMNALKKSIVSKSYNKVLALNLLNDKI